MDTKSIILMKGFYVLGSNGAYLTELDPVKSEGLIYAGCDNIGLAVRFESLCQALDFNESSGLQLEVLKVEITSVYTPHLVIPTFPGTDELVPQLDDPRWQEPSDEIVGYKCYGVDPTGGVGRGTLNRHHNGYFYILQYGGFEFGVDKVIVSERP
jgi:hypothetical protein